MQVAVEIAKHLRDTYFGGNWTSVNFRDTLKDVDVVAANAKVGELNTIVTLVFHTTYYLRVVQKVLDGGVLDGKDKDSFEHPEIKTEGEWQQVLAELWALVETFACKIEQLPDTQLSELFMDRKYGNWYRNLQGIVEHAHYHLGQIVIIKKMNRRLSAG